MKQIQYDNDGRAHYVDEPTDPERDANSQVHEVLHRLASLLEDGHHGNREITSVNITRNRRDHSVRVTVKSERTATLRRS